MNKNDYTPQQIQEAVDMYLGGGGIETIVRLFGGSRSGWKNRFARLGLSMRPGGVKSMRNEEQIAEVMRLRDEGMRFSKIGERLNITRQRAQQIYAREKMEVRPSDIRRAKREEVLRLYSAGVSVSEIVRECGLKSEGALRSLLYRWGATRGEG